MMADTEERFNQQSFGVFGSKDDLTVGLRTVIHPTKKCWWIYFEVFRSVGSGIHFSARGTCDTLWLTSWTSADSLNCCHIVGVGHYISSSVFKVWSAGWILCVWIRELSLSCQPTSSIETLSSPPNGCHVGVPLVETKCRLTSFIFLHDL